MEDFLVDALDAAEAIRSEGLEVEGERVHHSSWEWLAQINGKGFLTWNSQDAIDPVTGNAKDTEKPYVEGTMILDKAREFVDKFNLSRDDKIAMLCIPISKPMLMMPDGPPVKGATIAVSRRRDPKSGEWYRFAAMSAFTDSRMAEGWKSYDIQLIGVQVFDTKWGRSATSRNGLLRAILEIL